MSKALQHPVDLYNYLRLPFTLINADLVKLRTPTMDDVPVDEGPYCVRASTPSYTPVQVLG